MTWAVTVVTVGAVLLLVGLVGLGVAIGQAIRRADEHAGRRDDD